MRTATTRTARVINIEDTATINHEPGHNTRNLAPDTADLPTLRRPAADHSAKLQMRGSTFSAVDEPLATDAIPPAAQVAIHRHRYAGRHRTGLVARLRRLLGGAQ